MRGKSIVWLPILLVGSLVYWTLALGFGGRSLLFLTNVEYQVLAPETTDKDSYQSITVNLMEARTGVGETAASSPSTGPDEEVLDRAPAEEGGREWLFGDGSGQGARGGENRQGPGNTAF